MEKLQALLLERFQIVFSDTGLLETAFTHTSYANEHRLLKISHNERLEFLGDAVLQLVISEYLYKEHPNRPEGDLSKFRSMIVREESLAGFSLGIANLISISNWAKAKKNQVAGIVIPSLAIYLKPF